ncbi:MAG: T9SS type A sorting domain-containing protein [Bacteroidia bacterium]|nr:T9SS type A sorting domain-containing protein [Bacteroidia bacterium]
MKTLIQNLFFILVLVLFTVVFDSTLAQVDPKIQRYRDDAYGNKINRRAGTFDGNLIRSVFRNDGQIGYYSMNLTPPSFEWPLSSLHNYLTGYTLVVSSEITAPGNGVIIHPVQTSYSEFVDSDPMNPIETWTFHPIPGYSNPVSNLPAINIDSTTWPDVWPEALNLDSTYNEHWYSYFGRDNFYPTFESYYVMDDSRDKEWSRQPYSYYPVLNDTNRAGLGLRVETRIFQWNNELVEDIVFINHEITNLSDFDYPTTCFGIFTDPSIGGDGDAGDDYSAFFPESDLVYCFDNDGESTFPPPIWQTGYLGFAFLDSPNGSGPTSINSISVFSIYSLEGRLRNDELIWIKMSNNQVHTTVQNTNIQMVVGSGPFNYPKWTTEQFVVAMIMGENLNDLILNKTVAQIVYDSNYVIPDSISYVDNEPLGSVNNFDLMQNYPNPFNPTTTISYNVPFTSNIRIVVYDILGTEIKTLMNEEKIKGEYQLQFDATGLSSGVYYYSIFANDFAQTKKMILIK